MSSSSRIWFMTCPCGLRLSMRPTPPRACPPADARPCTEPGGRAAAPTCHRWVVDGRVGEIAAHQRAADALLEAADAQVFLAGDIALPRVLAAAGPRLLPHAVVDHVVFAERVRADAAVCAVRNANRPIEVTAAAHNAPSRFASFHAAKSCLA